MRYSHHTILVLAAALLSACTTVHTTEYCVGTTYGNVTEKKMSVGLNMTVIEDANCFKLTDQNYPADGGKDSMTTQTKDPMTVGIDISIVYAFDSLNVYDVFLEKRSEDAAEIQILNAMRDGVKAALASWYVTDLFSSRRADLGDSIKVHIQRKLVTAHGPLATIKQVFVKDIHVPASIEAARVAATNQALVLDKAQKQLAIDSMNARGQIITAQASAEANRLKSISYASNPKMLDVEIAEKYAGICKGVTTCIIGASPSSLLGVPGSRP